MKKLATAIVGLGLLLGTSLSANDTFNGFYPVVDNDTPDYLLDTKVEGENPTQVLTKSNIKSTVVDAFFPLENEDTPDYLRSNNNNDLNIEYSIHQPTISIDTFKAFFPIENEDTPDYLRS